MNSSLSSPEVKAFTAFQGQWAVNKSGDYAQNKKKMGKETFNLTGHLSRRELHSLFLFFFFFASWRC